MPSYFQHKQLSALYKRRDLGHYVSLLFIFKLIPLTVPAHTTIYFEVRGMIQLLFQ